MKKLSTASTDKLILKFVIKSVVSTVLSILLFSFIFSEITYKFDLDLEIHKVFAVIICALCASSVGYLSVRGFKNNGAVMGMASQVPLLFYCLMNLIFHDGSVLYFFIKAVIVLLCGALFGIFAEKKSKKFRVK